MSPGLTHAEWSSLTDAANQGTDEALIEVAERIIAARVFPVEVERDEWKAVAHDGAFWQSRSEEAERRALIAAADDLEGRLGTEGAPRNLWEFRQWLRDRAAALRADA